MDEDDRINVATLPEIDLGSCGFDIRHRFSPPSRTCVVGCRDRKTDRVAIGPTMSSRHCVAWRSIAGGADKRPRHLASAGARRVSRSWINSQPPTDLKVGQPTALKAVRDMLPATTLAP